MNTPTPPSQPQTRTAQGETQERVPPLPHERDESAHDTQPSDEPSGRRMGQLAQADVERGTPDTSRSVETDATYHRLRESAEQDKATAGQPPQPPPGKKGPPIRP